MTQMMGALALALALQMGTAKIESIDRVAKAREILRVARHVGSCPCPDRITERLQRLGKDARDPVFAELTSPPSFEGHHRYETIALAAELDPATAQVIFVSFLQTESLRSWAIYGLGKTKDAKNIDRIRPYLNSKDHESLAVDALGELRATQLIPELAALLGSDPRDDLRLIGCFWGAGLSEPLGRRAARALVKMGEAAIPELEEALSDSNVWVRRRAALALGLLKARDSATTIRRLFDDEKSTEARHEYGLALARMDDPAFLEWLIGHISSAPESFAEILAEYGNERAASALSSWISKPETQMAAMRAQIRAGNESGMRVVYDLLNCKNKSTADSAATCLVERFQPAFFGPLVEATLVGSIFEFHLVYAIRASSAPSKELLAMLGPLAQRTESKAKELYALCLGAIDDEIVLPELRRLVGDSDESVAVHAKSEFERVLKGSS